MPSPATVDHDLMDSVPVVDPLRLTPSKLESLSLISSITSTPHSAAAISSSAFNSFPSENQIDVVLATTTPSQFEFLGTLTPDTNPLTALVPTLGKRKRGHRRNDSAVVDTPEALFNSAALSAAAGMAMDGYACDLSSEEKRKRGRLQEDEARDMELDMEKSIMKNVDEEEASEGEETVDCDSGDVHDVLACVEYVDDICRFYKLAEETIKDYRDKSIQMSFFCEAERSGRKEVVDWLLVLNWTLKTTPETFYTALNLMDRYLAEDVRPRHFQLVATASTMIATKYHDVKIPAIKDYELLVGQFYTVHEILEMEKKILVKLDWNVGVPTPHDFLARFIKASLSPDDEMKNMVFFLAELGVRRYRIIITYSPSMIAATAVYAARSILNRTPFWTATLKNHTGYSEEQLRECAKDFVLFHLEAEWSCPPFYREYAELKF